MTSVEYHHAGRARRAGTGGVMRQSLGDRMGRVAVVTALAAGLGAACQQPPAPPATPAAPPPIDHRPFGTTPEGVPVNVYTLTNAAGMEVRITNYGGTVVSIKTPDRQGQMGDVVLGFDTLDGYLHNTPYFGVIVGRYGNRIAKGQFSLDGVTYTLARNDGENHLHGGVRGFDKVVWTAKTVDTADGPALELGYLSKDGEEGYPGNLAVTVRYRLDDRNALHIEYTATTDKPTVVNLTNHSYLNLAGTGDILSHVVEIDADRFTPVDKGLIPTGVLQPVAGTPFDFRTPTAIGARIDADNRQLQYAGGYDHNFVLNKAPGTLGLAARVTDPASGRVLEVSTTEPGVQFYSGNFLDGTVTGKGGRAYQKHAAFALETQHFPDSPNHPDFPSTVLRPDQTYHTTTIYAFPTPK
jgi:aldose 1-epimerase